MPPETEAEAPADDLRSQLSAAITDSEKPAEGETPKPARAQAEPVEDGKVESETEAAASSGETEAPAADTKEKPAEEAKPAAETTAAAETQKTLAGWKKVDQEMFKKQSPEAQQFLVRRHKEMTADYTKKLQDISRFKGDYEPVDKMFEPYKETMKQKGFTIPQLVESWANVEKKLASGDQGALEVIGGLINGYKVPRDKIAALIGIRPQAAATETAARTNGAGTAEQQAQPTPAQLPPEIMQMFQEVQNMKQAVTGLTTAQRQAQQAAVNAAGEKAMREIEEFKGATDGKGTLLRPYFEELEPDMLRLVRGFQEAKQPVPTLAELYETAVWAKPSTREKLLAAKEQSEEQKRADQAKTKAAAARKAAVSVTGAPGSGQASPIRGTPERSLREEIEERLAEQSAA